MKNGKILIIDDNEDVLFALNLLLEPYVEQIKVTTQPERIEHFMSTFVPDVILLDMNFRRDAISGQEGLLLGPEKIKAALTPMPWFFLLRLCRYERPYVHKGGGYRLYSETLGKRKTACYSLGSLETA